MIHTDGTPYSITTVRRALSTIRHKWFSHGPLSMFRLSDALSGTDASIAEFSFAFVISHHTKRNREER